MTPGEYLRERRRAARRSILEVAIAVRLPVGHVFGIENGRLEIPLEWRATLCAAVQADPAVLSALCAERASLRHA